MPALTHALDKAFGSKVQLAAATALGRFGADAAPAAPRLLQLLKQEDVALADAAADALTAMGLEIHDAVASYLRRELRVNRNVAARVKTLRNLGAMGPEAAPAVADLTPLLGDANAEVRMEAIHALGAIGPLAAPAVANLTALLTGTENDLRIEVAHALGAIGPGARAAVPALTRMADNSHASVRQAACDALIKISHTGQDLGPALIAAVMNGDHVYAERLAAELRRSPNAAALRARLIKVRDTDPDPAVRAAATRAVKVLDRDAVPE